MSKIPSLLQRELELPLQIGHFGMSNEIYVTLYIEITCKFIYSLWTWSPIVMSVYIIAVILIFRELMKPHARHLTSALRLTRIISF